jgi:isoleucyl-tRNA synthetase
VVVGLDVEITDALRREGAVREIVRHVQDLRKKSGCAITDRITLQLDGPVPEEWLEYIARETLAALGPVAEPLGECEIRTDPDVVHAKIARA